MFKSMITKLLFIAGFCVLIISACSANVMPVCVYDIPKASMGLYQTDKEIRVYSKPDENSSIVYSKTLNYENYKGIRSDNFFAVLVPDKELSYAYVTDVADDENWIQIVYDKEKMLKGWIQKKDDFQFLPWGTFFNMYGRKYGLYRLESKNGGFNGIYSQPNVNAQIMGKITRPKFIRMTSVEGCWMLITVLDLNDYTTTGYLQWCTDDGNILVFPDIK